MKTFRNVPAPYAFYNALYILYIFLDHRTTDAILRVRFQGMQMIVKYVRSELH